MKYSRQPHYRKGDYYLICDRTGRKIRRSDARKEWNGLIVHKDSFEKRHPQDFVRAIEDNQAVEEPRSEPPNSFGEVTTTTDAAELAGQTVISVTSTSGFTNGAVIQIEQDNDTIHLSTISSFVTNDTVTIADPLTWGAASGNTVWVKTVTVSH